MTNEVYTIGLTRTELQTLKVLLPITFPVLPYDTEQLDESEIKRITGQARCIVLNPKHLDAELLPDEHIKMAANGSLIANFFNQVQLEATGADISATSLGNTVKGLNRDVTIRDIVSTYIYYNTLKTLSVTRAQLKCALERSAEYFSSSLSRRLKDARNTSR